MIQSMLTFEKVYKKELTDKDIQSAGMNRYDYYYKIRDRKNRHVGDIKKVQVGKYYHWCVCPVPVIVDNKFYYNLCYTKNQLKEMLQFISLMYKKDFENKKVEVKNINGKL